MWLQLTMLLVTAHLVCGSSNTHRQCADATLPPVNLTCDPGLYIRVTEAVVGYSATWNIYPCPLDPSNPHCIGDTSDPAEMCDGKTFCSMSYTVIVKDIGMGCPPTSYIEINFTCNIPGDQTTVRAVYQTSEEESSTVSTSHPDTAVTTAIPVCREGYTSLYNGAIAFFVVGAFLLLCDVGLFVGIVLYRKRTSRATNQPSKDPPGADYLTTAAPGQPSRTEPRPNSAYEVVEDARIPAPSGSGRHEYVNTAGFTFTEQKNVDGSRVGHAGSNIDEGSKYETLQGPITPQPVPTYDRVLVN